MKKTFTTIMPDRIGAFLKAGRMLSELGVNITRVSYNKAVDTHMLFIEIDGSEEKIKEAGELLSVLGYLSGGERSGGVILLEFRIKDEPRRLLPILELIDDFRFNISYMSSEENNSDYQNFKIGIFVENSEKLSDFIHKASVICPVRILNYDKSERVLDNTVFYVSFAESIAEKMSLQDSDKETLMIAANRIMQTLDERQGHFYKTFDYINRLADHIEKHKDENFSCRITQGKTALGKEFLLVEPPCGSNVFVCQNGDSFFMVDSGFACYQEEIKKEIRQVYPAWKKESTTVLLTHSDVDHAGGLDGTNTVVLSQDAAKDLENEQKGKPVFREKNPLHKPYAQISKILTGYTPPKNVHFTILPQPKELAEPLTKLGEITVGELHFEVYVGKGGHVKGETVYLEREHRLGFTGDIFVNIKDFTKEQKDFNKLAPYLMTSVDTDPILAKEERDRLFTLLTEGKWQIIGGHGGIYTITV